MKAGWVLWRSCEDRWRGSVVHVVVVMSVGLCLSGRQVNPFGLGGEFGERHKGVHPFSETTNGSQRKRHHLYTPEIPTLQPFSFLRWAIVSFRLMFLDLCLESTTRYFVPIQYQNQVRVGTCVFSRTCHQKPTFPLEILSFSPWNQHNSRGCHGTRTGYHPLQPFNQKPIDVLCHGVIEAVLMRLLACW